jgi:hypothetical protein
MSTLTSGERIGLQQVVFPTRTYMQQIKIAAQASSDETLSFESQQVGENPSEAYDILATGLEGTLDALPCRQTAAVKSALEQVNLLAQLHRVQPTPLLLCYTLTRTEAASFRLEQKGASVGAIRAACLAHLSEPGGIFRDSSADALSTVVRKAEEIARSDPEWEKRVVGLEQIISSLWDYAKHDPALSKLLTTGQVPASRIELTVKRQIAELAVSMEALKERIDVQIASHTSRLEQCIGAANEDHTSRLEQCVVAANTINNRVIAAGGALAAIAFTAFLMGTFSNGGTGVPIASWLRALLA